MESFTVTSTILLAVAITSSAVGSESVEDVMKMSSSIIQLSEQDKRSVSTLTDDDDGSTDSVSCRSDRVFELLAGLSIGCQNYLFSADTAYEDFEEESSVICEKCGPQLYSLLQCLDADSSDLEMYDVLCTRNENGDKCYELLSGEGDEEREIIAECHDMTCSDECRENLEESFSRYGCCLYSLVALNTSMTMVHDMWSACGVEEPGMCRPTFSESPTDPSATTDESSDEPTSPPNTESSPTTESTEETTQTEPSDASDSVDPISTSNTPATDGPSAGTGTTPTDGSLPTAADGSSVSGDTGELAAGNTACRLGISVAFTLLISMLAAFQN